MAEHSHSHGHDAGPLDIGRNLERWLSGTAITLALLTVIGLVSLRPSGEIRTAASELGLTTESYPATVESAEAVGCSYDPEAACTRLLVVPLAGPDEGETVDLGELSRDNAFAPSLSAGDEIILDHEPSTDFYAYADRQRRPALWWLVGLFAVSVVALGRLRGVAALGSLAITVAVLGGFVVPAVLDGVDPVAVSVVGASAIAFVALYLTHGFRVLTTVALLGTLAALALTLGLAALFFELAHFTGAVSEEATYLPLLSDRIDVAGLLLGGVVLGALGALDDVTVTQAATVWELRRSNPSLDAAGLFRGGMAVGRSHVGSTVNTLLLAYAGASMPLLLLFVVSGHSLGTVANSEVVAVEIVRTLVGSIGLVAAVPLTTWFAARVAVNATPGDEPAAGHPPA
ncbi:MAG: YibE/F family protein [Actinomycetota bacterium]|nr:YibE/F family protein [Actinomycetota bacterium]